MNINLSEMQAMIDADVERLRRRLNGEEGAEARATAIKALSKHMGEVAAGAFRRQADAGCMWSVSGTVNPDGSWSLTVGVP
jgi:hypothetical protein